MANLDLFDQTPPLSIVEEDELPVVYIEVTRYNWGDTGIDIIIAGEPRYYGLYQILNPSLYKLPFYLRMLAHQGNDWAIQKCAQRVIDQVRPEFHDAPMVIVERDPIRGMS
jgi:hypothetical protein